MSTFTAGDAISEVRALCGLSSSDDIVADADMLVLVNTAARRLSTEYNWPWLQAKSTITLVVGTAEYSLPSDCLVVEALFYAADGQELKHRTLRRVIEAQIGADSYPTDYIVQGLNLEVGPTPADAVDLTLFYRKQETKAAATTDTYLIYDWAWDLLVSRTAILLAGRLKDSELRRLMTEEYNRAEISVRGSSQAKAPMKGSTRKDW